MKHWIEIGYVNDQSKGRCGDEENNVTNIQ